MKYAVRYIERYDANKDGVLTKEEWEKMPRDYSDADTDSNGNGKRTRSSRFSGCHSGSLGGCG